MAREHTKIALLFLLTLPASKCEATPPFLVIQTNTMPVHGFTFSRDSRFFAGGIANNIKIWDIKSRMLVKRVSHPDWDFDYGICYSEDGANITMHYEDINLDPWIDILRIADGRRLLRLPCKDCNRPQYSPSGKMLVAAGKRSRLWETNTGTEIGSFKHPNRYGHRAAFSHDSKMLAVNGWECLEGACYVCIWELSSFKLVHQWQSKDFAAFRIAFSSDNGALMMVETVS